MFPPRNELSLPQGKADQVAALLSDLSNGDTVTSVAEAVQLACFASEVNQCPKDLETDHVWERLLVFLQHLSRSK